MKKILATFMLIGSIFSPEFAHADTQGYEFSVYANYWDVKDGDDNVWGPGIAFAVPVYEKALKLDFRTTWLPDAGEDKLGDVELVPLDLGLSYHYKASENVDFYPMAGATYAFANADPKVDGIVDIDNNWGAYVGGGLAYYFTPNCGLFGNLYYRFLEFDTDVKPARVNGSTFEADGLNIDLGFRYAY